MICEKCGIYNATTHIHTIINGKLHEKHLCLRCATADGYHMTNSNNMTQMLSSIFCGDVTDSRKNHTLTCDCCGSSFNDIVNSGKCGCAQCYTTFYDMLLPYLKRAQYGGFNHKGKLPHKLDVQFKTSIEKVDELRELLKEYIEAERYEEAAIVRDQIKDLEGM